MWLNEWKHTAVFGLSNRNETTMQLYSLGNLLSLLFAKPEEKQMPDYIWNRDYKHLQNQTSRILAPFHCRCRVASWITAIPSGSVAAFAISGSFKSSKVTCGSSAAQVIYVQVWNCKSTCTDTNSQMLQKTPKPFVTQHPNMTWNCNLQARL